MKLAIYTSFAINYLAKARVLVDTIRAANPDVAIFGVVNDRFPSSIDPGEEGFDELWYVDDYPNEAVKSWIFRHNIMELSTAVKGWALVRLLERGYDYVMYMDPDGWVMQDPMQITKMLSADKSVAVVPHTTRPAETPEEIQIIETSSLRHGIYNLGFLLVRNDENGNKLANWWASRLDKFCVDDFESGLFTDQRWFDLAVGYFDFIEVFRHAGIDVASWNIGQRVVERDGDNYLVDGEPLIFYHFSGVGPAGVHRWVRDKFAPADPLAAELEFRYEQMINGKGQKDLSKIRPYYDFYSDGSLIAAEDRKYFRKHPELIALFLDPFDASQHPSFRTHAVAARAAEPASPDADTVGMNEEDRDGDLEVRARALFDGNVYRQATGASTTSDDELYELFLQDAWNPSIRANRFFDTSYYLSFVQGDISQEYISPFHHYIDKGIENNFSPSWVYDETFYMAENKEVADAVRAKMLGSGFEHFCHFGWQEGRSGCSFYNERSYLGKNDDVAHAIAKGHFVSGEEHYAMHGSREPRSI